jgi:fructose-1,6-bisphosphatase II
VVSIDGDLPYEPREKEQQNDERRNVSQEHFHTGPYYAFEGRLRKQAQIRLVPSNHRLGREHLQISFCPASRYIPNPVSYPEETMVTQSRPENREAKARSFGENIESDLASRFLRVVEVAAIASAHTMGQGARKLSDQVATEAMRQTMDNIPMRGTIVIGEGERDEAPMLYIGEKVGAQFPDGTDVPEVDIAVDPLEGTNLCATGAPGAITVLAASERGGLLNAPDCYMEKIVVGPSCRDAVDLDAPVVQNLKNIAKRLERDVEDLVVIVLDRPRHEKLIAEIRAAGARIKLIGDGDLSAGIAAAVIGTGVHAVMGSGGAPEGVITAAAIRCLNGYMQGRLVIDKPELEERIARMGIKDKNRVYEAEDLAPGKQLIFAATGVTDGALMRGVRFFGEGTRTSSVIMTLRTGKVRFIDSIHLDKGPDVKVRFT